MSKSDSIVAELRQHLVPILLRRSSDTSQLSKDGTRITSTPQVSPQVLAHRSRSDIPSSLQQSKSQDLKDSSLEEAIPPNIDEQPVSTHSSTTPIESEQFEKPVLTLERPTPEDDQIPVSRAIIRHTAPVEQHIPNGSTGNPLIEGLSKSTTTTESIGYFAQPAIIMSTQIILHKRVWVKRQGASATLVQISEEDLVDDVREKILKKYANSLGRTFDSPDVTIRIVPRLDSHGHFERSLGPEESVATALNQYYPTGQTIDEALIIDIPHRRTPRQSPRVYMDHHRPSENGGDYFSVMPVALNHSPHLHTLPQQPIHTISVLNTGQLPTVPLPSPGAVSRRHASYRPKYGRTTTSSPTAITTNISHTNPLQDRVPGTPGLGALLTPPISAVMPPEVLPPPVRAASPGPTKSMRPKRIKKLQAGSSQPTSLLDGGVPPISVLIVEDNIINLKLLEAFMKRLKVRWQTAMNGRDAVVKWRTGGFHLVLMDIQLPIMSGLEATREIRRLERVNGIGVLSDRVGESTDPNDSSEMAKGSDQLGNMDQFKSPVIVVALTASSLQSDRHEALAAGCNDFLTKPVNFVWLERKVMEWGCMQALIDFDGWRKWKDFSQTTTTTATKSTKVNSTTVSSTGTGVIAGQKSKRLTDPHSDSTDTNGTPPIQSSNPPIPNSLVALNDKSESADTIGSLDSMESNDSTGTIDQVTTQGDPTVLPPAPINITSTQSYSTAPPKEVTPRKLSASSPRLPSSSSSSSSTRDGFLISPLINGTNDITSASASSSSPTTTATPTAASISYEEARRRKRSSLGRGNGGLSGVLEELEGVGT